MNLLEEMNPFNREMRLYEKKAQARDAISKLAKKTRRKYVGLKALQAELDADDGEFESIIKDLKAKNRFSNKYIFTDIDGEPAIGIAAQKRRGSKKDADEVSISDVDSEVETEDVAISESRFVNPNVRPEKSADAIAEIIGSQSKISVPDKNLAKLYAARRDYKNLINLADKLAMKDSFDYKSEGMLHDHISNIVMRGLAPKNESQEISESTNLRLVDKTLEIFKKFLTRERWGSQAEIKAEAENLREHMKYKRVDPSDLDYIKVDRKGLSIPLNRRQKLKLQELWNNAVNHAMIALGMNEGVLTEYIDESTRENLWREFKRHGWKALHHFDDLPDGYETMSAREVIDKMATVYESVSSDKVADFAQDVLRYLPVSWSVDQVKPPSVIIKNNITEVTITLTNNKVNLTTKRNKNVSVKMDPRTVALRIKELV